MSEDIYKKEREMTITRKRREEQIKSIIDEALMAKDVKRILVLLEGTDGEHGLCRRVTDVEGDMNRAKGWAAAIAISISTIISFLGKKI